MPAYKGSWMRHPRLGVKSRRLQKHLEPQIPWTVNVTTETQFISPDVFTTSRRAPPGVGANHLYNAR
jgi:hypothetical protein